MLVGYMRVSSADDRQIRAIEGPANLSVYLVPFYVPTPVGVEMTR
jgi:hypothetical protein